ncbi:hypothetical protein P879_11246 [Paragonimus westermani]|uniref:Uncharacterized protein n=1 Tax=Paragonimus westermani TaxID=34504 RepID=A0A8T0DEU7_9TREM|nr:hypothetical protein P879_11246 [Paragonimus westermani]
MTGCSVGIPVSTKGSKCFVFSRIKFGHRTSNCTISLMNVCRSHEKRVFWFTVMEAYCGYSKLCSKAHVRWKSPIFHLTVRYVCWNSGL